MLHNLSVTFLLIFQIHLLSMMSLIAGMSYGLCQTVKCTQICISLKSAARHTSSPKTSSRQLHTMYICSTRWFAIHFGLNKNIQPSRAWSPAFLFNDISDVCGNFPSWGLLPCSSLVLRPPFRQWDCLLWRWLRVSGCILQINLLTKNNGCLLFPGPPPYLLPPPLDTWTWA